MNAWVSQSHIPTWMVPEGQRPSSASGLQLVLKYFGLTLKSKARKYHFLKSHFSSQFLMCFVGINRLKFSGMQVKPFYFTSQTYIHSVLKTYSYVIIFNLVCPLFSKSSLLLFLGARWHGMEKPLTSCMPSSVNSPFGVEQLYYNL